MRDYLIAQISRDRIGAERAWDALREFDRDLLDAAGLGLDNYKGETVEAPIGSTWKAHRSLAARVHALADRYLSLALL